MCVFSDVAAPLIISSRVPGGFLIIVIIVIIIVIIRKNKTQKKEMAPEPTKISMDSPPTYPTDPVEIRRMEHATPGMCSSFITY